MCGFCYSQFAQQFFISKLEYSLGASFAFDTLALRAEYSQDCQEPCTACCGCLEGVHEILAKESGWKSLGICSGLPFAQHFRE